MGGEIKFEDMEEETKVCEWEKVLEKKSSQRPLPFLLSYELVWVGLADASPSTRSSKVKLFGNWRRRQPYFSALTMTLAVSANLHFQVVCEGS